MTTYILKTILCSAILLLFYYLVLQREKIYRFNRFYLLLSIVFAFIVPLVTIKIRQSAIEIPEIVYQQIIDFQRAISQQAIPTVKENITPTNYLLIIYLAVTIFLLSRFLINIYILSKKIKNNGFVPYNGAKLVLTADEHVPHSFLNYIFINKEDFEQGKIEKEIFSHELAHIRQRHSLDILFIELITLFAWINPFLYFYRRAVQLNHEFLADKSVVNALTSPRIYQLLLLDKARQPRVLVLSSSFNYLQTKKRIIMMTRETSHRTALVKQIALIPVIAAAVLFFSTKVIARDTKIQPKQQNSSALQHQWTPENVPSFNHDKYSFTMGFSSWVASQIKYPTKALKEKIRGWVHIGYTVEPDGTISNVTINSAPDPLLGEAAANVVKSSPKWMPGKNLSPVKSSVSIKFEIPEKVVSSQDIPVFTIDKVPFSEELHPSLDAEQLPHFPLANAATLQANDEAIGKWVDQHLKYPKKAIGEKVEGTVQVRFIVTKSGKLEDLSLVNSIHPLLDEEALRVISQMPDWKPAMQGGEPKDVYYYTAVVFKLPK
jgi:TonB family protein